MTFPFRLYGHRGAAAHHPENTMASFRAALAAGADALETDVRLSSDGEVVVFHDADGARTCDDPRVVRACDWQTLSTWDAGRGERLHRLSDLLEAVPDVFVNVDLKDDLPEAAERTIGALRMSIGDGDVGAAAAIGEEVEWYLLARLAAQRSVSLAGSLPLLLDDALQGLDEPELQHVLDRLERMAEAVQVIVVSEDPTVAEWAHLAGAERAAVVRPGAP